MKLPVQVCQPGKAEPMVRVPWNDAVVVKRVLDLGAQTILFPMINTVRHSQAPRGDVAAWHKYVAT